MAEIQGRIRLLEAKGLGLREGREEGGQKDHPSACYVWKSPRKEFFSRIVEQNDSEPLTSFKKC